LPVSAAANDRPDQCPNIVFGHTAHRGFAECRVQVLVETALQFSIAIFPHLLTKTTVSGWKSQLIPRLMFVPGRALAQLDK
jgi:hypothetical protein